MHAVKKQIIFNYAEVEAMQIKFSNYTYAKTTGNTYILWEGNTLLSDVDLKRVFGKGITIFPIVPENIDGGSLDITASNLAWSCETGLSVINNGKINIPSHQSVIVISQETICLSKKYAGTCHSRVSLVARGLGPVSTPMKPNSHGRLSITLHNNSNKDLEIAVGEAIVVIMFEAVKTKAQITHDNNNSSPEVLSQMGIKLTPEQVEELLKAANLTHKQIMIKLKGNEEYKHFVSIYPHTNTLFRWQVIVGVLLLLQVILIFIPLCKDFVPILSATIAASTLIFIQLWNKNTD